MKRMNLVFFYFFFAPFRLGMSTTLHTVYYNHAEQGAHDGGGAVAENITKCLLKLNSIFSIIRISAENIQGIFYLLDDGGIFIITVEFLNFKYSLMIFICIFQLFYLHYLFS